MPCFSLQTPGGHCGMYEELIGDAEPSRVSPLRRGARDWEGAGLIPVCARVQHEDGQRTGSPKMSPKQTYVAALVREVTDAFFGANCQFH